MRIPYGVSNFAVLRTDRYFYVDKTPFLPELESIETGVKYGIFLRPRRFGKSTLLSMLEHYYDVGWADQFDALFSGLWVHKHPTPERGQYLVLSLDFSPVNTDGDAAAIRASFTATVKSSVGAFLARNSSRLPALGRLAESLDSYDDAGSLMSKVLSIMAGSEQKLYLLIDEYDHFGNRLLSDGNQAVYEAIVRGTGFVRSFYAGLKAGTTTGALRRMFITGVSPIMLDDLSSGFNIITHLSQEPRLNALAGFTRADVERGVDELLLTQPGLLNDARVGSREALLATMERHYDGYRFSRDAGERIFNSDLVLYFLRRVAVTGRYPEPMLDLNVRTDYGRLQRIATLSGAAGAGTRQLLESILTEPHIVSPLVEQFGARSMYGRAQLVSLFYYMGMLTFSSGAAESALPELVIPNLVIRELQWEYLAFALQDQEDVSLDMSDLEVALSAMAIRGDIGPLVAQFREQVVARIGNKDLRQFNEKVLKLMLLAYISQSRMFSILSEKEFSGGYCDLFLGLTGQVPAAKFAWMLEVKYLKTHAKPAEINRAFEEAYSQLARYTSDAALVSLLTLGKELKAGALVFVGAKDVVYRPWPPLPEAGPAAPKKRAAKKASGARAKKQAPKRKPTPKRKRS